MYNTTNHQWSEWEYTVLETENKIKLTKYSSAKKQKINTFLV